VGKSCGFVNGAEEALLKELSDEGDQANNHGWEVLSRNATMNKGPRLRSHEGGVFVYLRDAVFGGGEEKEGTGDQGQRGRGSLNSKGLGNLERLKRPSCEKKKKLQ